MGRAGQGAITGRPAYADPNWRCGPPSLDQPRRLPCMPFTPAAGTDLGDGPEPLPWGMCMRMAIALWLYWPLTSSAPVLANADDAEPFVRTAPASLPDPTATLDAAEYAQLMAVVVATVDVAELKRSGMPAAGLEIIKVKPGTQAKTLGIMAGDIIVAVEDGNPRFQQDFSAARDKGPDTLEPWDPTHGTHRLVLESGLLGITCGAVWHPEVGYLRMAHRSALWHREVGRRHPRSGATPNSPPWPRPRPTATTASLCAPCRIAPASMRDGSQMRWRSARRARGRCRPANGPNRSAPCTQYASALRGFTLPEAQSILARPSSRPQVPLQCPCPDVARGAEAAPPTKEAAFRPIPALCRVRAACSGPDKGLYKKLVPIPPAGIMSRSVCRSPLHNLPYKPRTSSVPAPSMSRWPSAIGGCWGPIARKPVRDPSSSTRRCAMSCTGSSSTSTRPTEPGAARSAARGLPTAPRPSAARPCALSTGWWVIVVRSSGRER